MAREHLSKRDNWQRLSQERGNSAENIFDVVMSMHCEGSGIETLHKPQCLREIYDGRFGIVPEFRFYNPETNKKIYVEMKRQGAGGNAHERACKYFAPGILNSIRKEANQPPEIIPVWFIFSNGLAKDPKKRVEITHWFEGYNSNFLLWKSLRDKDTLIDHFEKHIKGLLL